MKIRGRSSWAPLAVAIVAVSLSGCGGAGGGSFGASLTSGGSGEPTVMDSAAGMAVGDVAFVKTADEGLVIDFTGVSEGSGFALVIGTSSSDDATNLLMSNDLLADAGKGAQAAPDASESAAGAEDPGPEEMLSAWLRASEQEFARQAPPPSAPGGKAMMDKAAASAGGTARINIQSSRTFRVLTSLTSLSQYATVTANARCVTEGASVFVDVRVGSDLLSQGDVDEICREFDEIAEWEYGAFGAPSDVDGDGIVRVLITPQVNMIGGSSGGPIGGYFYAADLYPQSDDNPASNEQEIIFALAPDPQGVYGYQISKDSYIRERIAPVLAHELQHAINYNQHALVMRGEAEEVWLNEGLSHLAEDLTGYGNGNSGRYAGFLASPSATPLVAGGMLSVAGRGATYLFLRYLYEQSGDGGAFLARLVQSEISGIENLERAFAGSDEGFDDFGDFMARWSAALVLGSRGFVTDSEYAYQPRIMDSRTGNWRGAALMCNEQTGCRTTISGVSMSPYEGYENSLLASTSAQYFTLWSVPEQIGVQLSGGSNYAVLIRTE